MITAFVPVLYFGGSWCSSQQQQQQQQQQSTASLLANQIRLLSIYDNDNIDLNIKIPDRLIQFTATKIPQTATMASASKIPFGAILRPLATPGPKEEDVQPCSAGIVRCKRCQTYINAFVAWSENGRFWICNICAQTNDCPPAYFCHLDEAGLRRDRFERPELSKGVVEFIAPPKYVGKKRVPPQDPSYFFAIDVSATSVRSGMLHSVSAAIKRSLDNLPGRRRRTKIGFITFDNSVHYYNLASDLSYPHMLVVSDLKELFVPSLPHNLLVNLYDSRKAVEAFLDSLPEMFSKNPVVSQSCLGPALKAAFTIMKQFGGGKMCVFQSIMPNLGEGSLKPRENRGLMGTPGEVKLIRPDTTWYKGTAMEFSRQQICVDMFLFPHHYMDVAALSDLPRYTAGSLHSYVNFNHEKDGPRFEQQLEKVLTQTTAFEAVMRVRCTIGMRVSKFYGNFSIRDGTDLLVLPNCNTDSTFGFDLVHDESTIKYPYVTIQAALLYTRSNGERRVRVMTQVLPVGSQCSDIVRSINTDATCSLLSKQAVEVAVESSIDKARMSLEQTCVEIVRTAKEGDKHEVSGYLVPPGQGGPNKFSDGNDNGDKPLPKNLQLLPLYTLALMKNVAFRGGTDVHPDERVQAHQLIDNMWVSKLRDFIYPRMYSLHDMDTTNAGHPLEGCNDDNEGDNNGKENQEIMTVGKDRIQLPSLVNLSAERLTSEGIFLLDNGVDMYLWVGRTAPMDIVSSLFGLQTLDDIDPNQIKLLTRGDNDLSSRLGAILSALREDNVTSKVTFIREGDTHSGAARFFWSLVEDSASFQGGTFSYVDFVRFVHNPDADPGGPMSAWGGFMRGGGTGAPLGAPPGGMSLPDRLGPPGGIAPPLGRAGPPGLGGGPPRLLPPPALVLGDPPGGPTSTPTPQMGGPSPPPAPAPAPVPRPGPTYPGGPPPPPPATGGPPGAAVSGGSPGGGPPPFLQQHSGTPPLPPGRFGGPPPPAQNNDAHAAPKPPTPHQQSYGSIPPPPSRPGPSQQSHKRPPLPQQQPAAVNVAPSPPPPPHHRGKQQQQYGGPPLPAQQQQQALKYDSFPPPLGKDVPFPAGRGPLSAPAAPEPPTQQKQSYSGPRPSHSCFPQNTHQLSLLPQQQSYGRSIVPPPPTSHPQQQQQQQQQHQHQQQQDQYGGPPPPPPTNRHQQQQTIKYASPPPPPVPSPAARGPRSTPPLPVQQLLMQQQHSQVPKYTTTPPPPGGAVPSPPAIGPLPTPADSKPPTPQQHSYGGTAPPRPGPPQQKHQRPPLPQQQSKGGSIAPPSPPPHHQNHHQQQQKQKQQKKQKQYGGSTPPLPPPAQQQQQHLQQQLAPKHASAPPPPGRVVPSPPAARGPLSTHATPKPPTSHQYTYGGSAPPPPPPPGPPQQNHQQPPLPLQESNDRDVAPFPPPPHYDNHHQQQHHHQHDSTPTLPSAQQQQQAPKYPVPPPPPGRAAPSSMRGPPNMNPQEPSPLPPPPPPPPPPGSARVMGTPPPPSGGGIFPLPPPR